MTMRCPPLRQLVATALLLAPIVALAAPPAPYSARYEVRRNGEPMGEATVSFKKLANGRYELNSSTDATGGLAGMAGASIDERSIIRWSGDRPETVAYSYDQKVAWKQTRRGMKVDAGNRRIDVEDKKKRYSPAYQPGVLDRNAVTVAVMQDIAAGRTDLQYLLPKRDQMETHVYRAAAPERIDTALGPQSAIRVERIRESANGRTTTLWLGRDQRFVPLRILQKEPDGETIEMRITSLR